ncbi:MAG: omptin family outer membrane protease [Desulfarculus sp.]|nr:omptin family outer membrane protease [Desulfarculus sp.]
MFARTNWFGPALAGLLVLMLGLGCLPALATPAEPPPAEAPAEGFYVAPKVRRLLSSHTSYQFGNPLERQVNPLSRLEFPLDSWWGGLEVGFAHPHYSWRLEAMTNISRDLDGGRMKDSDWDDASRPGVKTIYSESWCRLKPSLTLDGSVDYSLRQHVALPRGLDLRPVIGLRYQRYTFETYDGVQTELGQQDTWGPGVFLGGEGIWFRQEYLHSYLGLRLSQGFDLPQALVGPGRRGELFLQGDWAYVVGDNRDHHLKRTGDRITQEHTTGDAWHAALGLKLPLGDVAYLNLTGDYLRIRTTGTHTLYNSGVGLSEPLSFDYGVEAWSDQYSLTLSLEIPLSTFWR